MSLTMEMCSANVSRDAEIGMMGIAALHPSYELPQVYLLNLATSSTCGVWRNWSTAVTPSIL